MVRLIDRYVLREFLLYLLLGVSSFVGIYLIVDLFEKIDTFVDHRAAAHLVFDYYLNNLPVILIQVLPVAMLLAVVLAFGQLRRFNEVSAMQSCGLSPLRITTPLLLVAVLISGGAFLLGEEVVPDAYRQQQETLDVRIKKKRPADQRGRSGIYYMGRGGRVYVAQHFEPLTPRLVEVSLQQFARSDAGQELYRRLDAAEARWRPGGVLEFRDGTLRSFRAGEEKLASFARYADTRTVEQPDEFTRIENDPFNMNRRDLADYIARIRAGGAKVNQYQVDYHLRAAFPASNFIMVLLGSCLSLRILRGGMALGFGVSLFLGFAYYGFLRVGQALGYTGHVPPLLAAWLGNLVFGFFGAVLFWRVNR